MHEIFDLRVHINGKHTFFLDKRIVCKFSGRIRKMVKQERKRSSFLAIEDFPGGGHGFELVSRFCYSGGRTAAMTPADLGVLHCSAFLLEMTGRVGPASSNLLERAEAFLRDELPCWPWADVLTSLERCNSFLSVAVSSGLLEKLVSALVARINGDSDAAATMDGHTTSNSSCSSTSSSSLNEVDRRFGDLTVLSPHIVGKIAKALGSQSSVSTRLLLHYLNATGRRKARYNDGERRQSGYGGLADALVDRVHSSTESGGALCLPFRWLLWVLRVVTGLGLSEERGEELERTIGEKLDEATLDDLLDSGPRVIVGDGAYDVSLVARLVGVFVKSCEEEEAAATAKRRMRRVGRLMDAYLVEISPDQSLNVSGFVGVARTLPDSARECFDGVYRALDIYLQSHPTLSSEERANLCQCLNYEKLTLGACRDLAKNPKIPPSVSFQALVAKHSKLQIKTTAADVVGPGGPTGTIPRGRVLICATNTAAADAEKGKWRTNIERENCGVMESEGRGGMKVPLLKSNSSIKHFTRGLPGLC